MKFLFRESFTRDLRRIDDRDVLRRIRQAVETVEQASNLLEIPHLTRLRSQGRHYRIRVGDYRLGLTVEEEQVVFVRVLHRREIYRYFP
ncbi:MAG TPA: type II toxin-antitoxin system RelE/ParE family toxin [Thermoanaerobaculia bacterium]|nr:type II toxin-antitoxin system RelE/ParE family toxin [Thermoanaerobaculia bacterium]